MNIAFVDYTVSYYSTVAKKAVPDRFGGKFVQIRDGATEYLVFAPKEYASFHAEIVERFCSERGLTGSYNAERTIYRIAAPGWVVAGGGKFETDKNEKSIRLYDNSMAYGRFDSKGLIEKLRSIRELDGYTVRIE